MKLIEANKFVIFSVIGVVALLYSLNVFAFGQEVNSCNFIKAKADMFQQAIDDFGAISPDEAAFLWAKGVKGRNGALQYAVMDSNLKKAFNDNMEKERPSWVTGVSSPWVEYFEIVKSEKEDDSTYYITVRFDLATSTGSAGSYNTCLLIVKDGKYWVIEKIAGDSQFGAF